MVGVSHETLTMRVESYGTNNKKEKATKRKGLQNEGTSCSPLSLFSSVFNIGSNPACMGHQPVR